VINLAVIDLLVGGFAVYDLFYLSGAVCIQWKRLSIADRATYVVLTLTCLLPNSSLTNITVMALERVHVTFLPLKHHVLKKRVYGVIIAVVWVTATLVAISDALLKRFEIIFLYLRITFCSICLLIICVSYTSIVVKARCGAKLHHHGAASRERKLTMTLLIVTVVSLLFYLPYVISALIVSSFASELWRSLPDSVDHAIYVLFYANSLVNPILYAIRLPEYRSAVLVLFRKRPRRQRQVGDLPLRDV